MENPGIIKSVAETFKDEELISRILMGEINLYQHIISKYNQRLYRYV